MLHVSATAGSTILKLERKIVAVSVETVCYYAADAFLVITDIDERNAFRSRVQTNSQTTKRPMQIFVKYEATGADITGDGVKTGTDG